MAGVTQEPPRGGGGGAKMINIKNNETNKNGES